jgi:hypothetical protein
MTIEEIINMSDQDWINKIKTQEFSMETLGCWASHIPDKAWNYLAIYQKLTSDFILDFDYKFDIAILLTSQVIHEKTIRDNLWLFQDYMWHACRYQYLSEAFITDHLKLVDLKQLYLHQDHLSLSFIIRTFKYFPRDEFIYEIKDIFHNEIYQKHGEQLNKIVTAHNARIRKVSARSRIRSRA